MAAVTPTATEVEISGNKVKVYANFTAISDTETWTPGLTTIDGAWITNGANDVDIGATFSGGTITFQCAGAMANVKVVAVGT